MTLRRQGESTVESVTLRRQEEFTIPPVRRILRETGPHSILWRQMAIPPPHPREWGGAIRRGMGAEARKALCSGGLGLDARRMA